jgi:signal transduction histidine kinase
MDADRTVQPLHRPHQPPTDKAKVIEVLQAAAAPLLGEEYLQNLVMQLGELFQAETTFIAIREDPESTRVRGIAAWKDGAQKDTWEYDLTGNPCHLVYDGKPVFIPCAIAEDFKNKADSGYESFLGYPLLDDEGNMLGHIAIYSSKVLEETEAWHDICRLFADRARVEILRERAAAERDRTIAQLRELDALKNEFISIAAHDMRGPLGVVRGLAKMLSMGMVAPEKQGEISETIMTASDRMIELVEKYLNFSEIQSAELSLQTNPVDVSTCVEERLEVRKVLAEDNNVHLEFEAENGIVADIDRNRFWQAIDNIVDNAIKFSPNGGKVSISVRSNQGQAIIAISDEGQGIPEDVREHLFDPFVTSGENWKSGKGYGLGLMIAQRVINAHGGKIEVTSSPGGGSRFEISIPLQ